MCCTLLQNLTLFHSLFSFQVFFVTFNTLVLVLAEHKNWRYIPHEILSAHKIATSFIASTSLLVSVLSPLSLHSANIVLSSGFMIKKKTLTSVIIVEQCLLTTCYRKKILLMTLNKSFLLIVQNSLPMNYSNIKWHLNFSENMLKRFSYSVSPMHARCSSDCAKPIDDDDKKSLSNEI